MRGAAEKSGKTTEAVSWVDNESSDDSSSGSSEALAGTRTQQNVTGAHAAAGEQ